MADNTLAGLLAIVAIVLIASFYFASSNSVGANENRVGGAITTGFSGGDTCEPNRYCDGSKLVIINDDCSIFNAYCKYGCGKETATCN